MQTRDVVEEGFAYLSRILSRLPTPALRTARGFAYYPGTQMLFRVLPFVFPYGFSSKRETARSLNRTMQSPRNFSRMLRRLTAVEAGPSFGSFLECVKRFVTNFPENRSVPHASLTAANMGS